MPPPAGLQIDAATPADVPLILRLVRSLAEYEHLGDAVTATERDVHETLFGPSRAAEAAIARVGDDAVGFAVWFFTYSTFLARPGLYLEDVFVVPEWRGRGIGRAILAHLARIALARKCGRMEWSVLDWNEPAIRFYRALGARPLDEWTVFRLSGDALERLARST